MGLSSGTKLFRLVRLSTIFLVFTYIFSRGIAEQPYFIDEGAYLAQTYYYRLVKSGQIHHFDWFHLAAYDQLNVGRTLMGLGLDLHGYELPRSLEEIEAWYGVDPTGAKTGPPADLGRLVTARWSMLVGASLGCLGVYVLLTRLVGPMTGLIGAALLSASPLYFTHAQRAMADDWTIAFLVWGLAILVDLGKRLPTCPRPLFGSGLLQCALAGLAFGLSAGTKLNGGVGLLAVVVGTGFILASAAPWRQIGPTHAVARAWGLYVTATVLAAIGTFIAVHPYFYARPPLPPTTETSAEVIVDGVPRSRAWIDQYVRPLAMADIAERAKHMLSYRRAVLQEMLAKNRFPEDSLPTVADRMQAIVVEGMGRWSYAGRFGFPSVAWIPVALLSLLGLSYCLHMGAAEWHMGHLPLAWLIVCWLLIEVIVLGRELTLDWDRYYRGIVTLVSITSAIGVGSLLQWINQRLVLLPPTPLEDPADDAD